MNRRTTVHQFLLGLVGASVWLGLAPSASALDGEDATHLHVLMVCCTEKTRENDISASAQKTRDRLFAVLRDGIPEHRRTVAVYDGENGHPAPTREGILEYYRRLSVRPTDSIFCYYAGHGGINQQGEHEFSLGGWERGEPGIKRSEILAAMREKEARLAILLTDCCSSYSAGPPQARAQKEPHFPDQELLRSLFFRHRGLLDMTAASPGQMGWGVCGSGVVDDGMLFTTALASLCAGSSRRWLRQPGLPRHATVVAWKDFVPELISETERVYALVDREVNSVVSKDGKRGDLYQEHGPDTQTPYVMELAEAAKEPILFGTRFGLAESSRLNPATGESVPGALQLGFGIAVDRGKDGHPAIFEVKDNSLGDWLGFRTGDVIVSLNGEPVATPAEFRRVVARYMPKSLPNEEGLLRFRIYRTEGGQPSRVIVAADGTKRTLPAPTYTRALDIPVKVWHRWLDHAQ
jgi:hypothetical protein